MGQSILGLETLHTAGFAHHDIKTPNIVLFNIAPPDEHPKWLLRFIDMDDAVVIDSAGKPQEYLGASDIFSYEGYSAPEYLKAIGVSILSSRHALCLPITPQGDVTELDLRLCDIYSLGEVFQELKKHLSESDQAICDDLISQMKNPNAHERYNIEQVKQHVFFGETEAERSDFFQAIAETFHQYRHTYVNGYLVRSPSIDDPFFLLSEEEQELVLLAQKLKNQLTLFHEHTLEGVNTKVNLFFEFQIICQNIQMIYTLSSQMMGKDSSSHITEFSQTVDLFLKNEAMQTTFKMSQQASLTNTSTLDREAQAQLTILLNCIYCYTMSFYTQEQSNTEDSKEKERVMELFGAITPQTSPAESTKIKQIFDGESFTLIDLADRLRP